MSRSTLTACFVLTSCFVLPARAARAEGPSGGKWSYVSHQNGIVFERRSVTGSSFYELRATVESPVPPERLLATIWKPPGVTRQARKYIHLRQVLRETPTERVVYEQVKTPVIADRDYTMVLRRGGDPRRHAYQIRFNTDNALGPPADGKHVRMPVIRGGWTLEPTATGGTHIVYTVLSEPGGSLPAFLAGGAQMDSCRDLVVEILEIAEAHPELSLKD